MISKNISYKYGIKKAYYHLGLAKEQAGFDFIANDLKSSINPKSTF